MWSLHPAFRHPDTLALSAQFCTPLFWRDVADVLRERPPDEDYSPGGFVGPTGLALPFSRNAFQRSTTRRNSLYGFSWSSTWNRRTVSLFSQLPPPFLTTTIDAACIPRVSPPAAWPA